MAKTTSLPYGARAEPEPFSVKLRYQGGGSDKGYELTIEPKGEGWSVNYANYRWGGTPAIGTKTQAPVSYEAAAKICNAQLSEKVGKGYVPVAGSRFLDGATAEVLATIEKRASGFVPQLLNAIDDDQAGAFMRDGNFVAQEKMNGERRPVIVADGKATGGNRKGQTVTLVAPIAKSLLALGRDVRLDGEQVGDVLHVFDIVALDGRDISEQALSVRLATLATLDLSNSPALRVVATAVDEVSKRALHARVTAANGEGLVFKRASSAYVAGRPNSGGDALKVKFYKTLSAVVSSVNDKRSVSLALVDDAGGRMGVGNVTVPANYPVPEAGDVVEVRYLYAYDGGSLVQPIFEGKRTDVEPAECLASQRVFKPDVEESDDVAMTM